MNVSFLLVNYFSKELTLRCVETIIRNTQNVSYEILVFDNNSGMNSAELEHFGPNVRFEHSDRNLGYGAACDAAAKLSTGKYLLFLNNDSEFQNNSSRILCDYLENHSNVALVGPQLVTPDGRHVPSFDYFPTISSKLLGVGLLRKWSPRKFPSKDSSRNTPTEVDVITGPCLFIRAEVYRELGGFDPRFFLYCEEEDLAMRVHKAGYKVVFVPEAKVMHIGGGSSKDKPALKKEFYISFFKFYRKHYGFFKTQILKLICAQQFFLRYILRDEKECWGPLILWMFKGSPESESLRYAAGNIDGPLISK